MTIYKGCPYCDAVFAIGPEDDWPLKQHLLDRHTGPERRTEGAGGKSATPDHESKQGRGRTTWPVEALCRRFHTTDDAAEVRRLALAVLHERGVSDFRLGEWFELEPETVRRLREEVEAADPGQP